VDQLRSKKWHFPFCVPYGHTRNGGEATFIINIPSGQLEISADSTPKQELPLVGWMKSRTGLEAPEK